jgi:hypothetical protein
MKKKKAKYVAKKGRTLTAKQTKKIRGGMGAIPLVPYVDGGIRKRDGASPDGSR